MCSKPLGKMHSWLTKCGGRSAKLPQSDITTGRSLLWVFGKIFVTGRNQKMLINASPIPDPVAWKDIL